MPVYLRQSTASQEVPLGHFVDATDGVTAETGLTIANTDIQVWKTGATALANKNSGGATHMAGGVYYTVLDATDTNTIGPLVLFVAVAGALAVRLECCVLDEAVYDAMFGTVALATATNITAGTITTVTTVTNQLTAAAVATGVWQDTTAGDFTTAGSIGKSLFTSGAVPGAAGGHFIAGTNAATAVTTALTTTFTGSLTGSVASVSGAVGSVTGSVGSVASGGITAASIATGAIDADALAADAVDEILDDPVEGSVTLRQAIRLMLAALAGKLSGAATTTVTIRDVNDTADRIVATVDASGNRTAVTVNGA